MMRGERRKPGLKTPEDISDLWFPGRPDVAIEVSGLHQHGQLSPTDRLDALSVSNGDVVSER